MSNGGYNGKFNRRGVKIHERAKQAWKAGEVVRVGFVDGLKVIGLCDKRLIADAENDCWLLIRGETNYLFEPHRGLSKLSHQQWLDASRAYLMTVQP